MEQIVENSLYTTQAEKDALIANKEAVANAFFINFLGTLGLFSISSSRGIMKTYFADDGKLQLTNIGDANKDTSLAVKLYSDIGGLKPDVSMQITRLLYKMKSRAITSKTLDENVVRELVQKIQYLSHRPHPIILSVVKDFESGVANLKQVAKAFYGLVKTRKKDLMPVSGEFYAIARQYLLYFKDIPDIGSTVAATASISTPAPQIVVTSVPQGNHSVAQTTVATAANVNQTPKAVVQVAAPTPKAVPDEAFYRQIWRASSKVEINRLFKEIGIKTIEKTHIQEVAYLMLPKTLNERNIGRVVENLSDFETGFGPLLKTINKNILSAAILWHLNTSSNVTRDLLGPSSNFIDKNIFTSYQPMAGYGYSTYELQELVKYKILVENRLHILQAGPTTDLKLLFRERKELVPKLMEIIGATSNEIADSLYKTLTVEQLAKFKLIQLIAGEIGGRYDPNKQAIKTMIEAGGAKVDIVGVPGRFGSLGSQYVISNYENMFPNSKQCIESWVESTVGTSVTISSPDSIDYDSVVKAWKDYWESKEKVALILSLNPKVTTESLLKEIVPKVKEKYGPMKIWEWYKEYATTSDELTPLTFDQDGYGLFLEMGEYLLEEINKGTFANYQGDSRTGLDSIIIKLISTNWSRFALKPYSGKISALKGDNVIKVFKAYVAKNREFAAHTLTQSISGVYHGLSLFTIAEQLGFSTEEGLKVISDITSSSVGEMEISYYKSAEIGLYITPELISKISYKLPFKVLIDILATHKMDIMKFMTYEDYVAKLTEWLGTKLKNNNYISGEQVEFFEKAITYLNPADRKILGDDIASKMFYTDYTGTPRMDINKFQVMEIIVGKEEADKFLSNLAPNEVKGLYKHDIIFFTERAPSWLLNDAINTYTSNFSETYPKTLIKRKDDLTIETKIKIFQLSKIPTGLKPKGRAYYEELKWIAFSMVLDADPAKADDLFLEIELNDRKKLVAYLIEGRFMEASLENIQGDNTLIKPFNKVSEERLLEILKYNNIEVPRRPIVKDGVPLSQIMLKITSTPPVKDLHVTKNDLTEEDLERLSVEYDIFNKGKHGDLVLMIQESFNVSVPLQEEGFKKWLAKMEAENTPPKLMKPVFHGTGSVGASMILRYGFTVVRSNDPSVVGRALGDGIYFSNVLDKVGQYVGDEGFTRRAGTKGFIFEMEASLGKHKRDYRCAATKTPEDEPRFSHFISPEWAVFTPNEQLRITKAFKVELQPRMKMQELKEKHIKPNEETAVPIKGFKSFINEGAGDMQHCVTYIFMDGDIPVSEKESVDFGKFVASRFGKNVKMALTGSGPSVMIYNTKESATYVVRYTVEFMKDRYGEMTKFFKMLKGS